MAKKDKIGGLVDKNNLDMWLRASGYLFPRNETELDLFEKTYTDYDFKLVNKSIDIDSIINGDLKCQVKVLPLFDSSIKHDIVSLKMAARKGEQSISKEILDKMKNKHKNGDK